MKETEPTSGWNGYLDWMAELARAQGRLDKTALWEPIFVRSCRSDITTRAFFETLATEEAIRFAPFEILYNLWGRQAGDPVEAYLYRRCGAAEPEGHYEVLTTGAPVEEGQFSEECCNAFEQAETAHPVALGIIDDGIAMLHPRFRATPETTRIDAIWMQSSLAPGASGPDAALSGTVYRRGRINHLIARTGQRTEEEIYRDIAQRVYPRGTRHSMVHPASHGTMMLDLAAGVDPMATGAEDVALRQVPILAVQSPPDAFDDTTGIRLQSHILQGLRWLIAMAIARGFARKLVVNLSLGVVAGPKDGNSFLEQQIRREIERVQRVTDGYATVEIVFSFGNAYEEAMVALRGLEAGESLSLDLRVPADDPSPSFVELRLSGQGAETSPDAMVVEITGPDGSRHGGSIPAGRHLTVPAGDGRPAARIYHTPHRTLWEERAEPAYLLIAFAPSESGSERGLTAPYGVWDISVRNGSKCAMDLIIQAQRDDSPFPRRTGARQARFDAPDAHGWSEKYRDFSRLEPDCRVTHEGSQSAFSTVDHPQVHRVGGARVQRGADGGWVLEPASYSAEGTDWSLAPGPTASAISESTASGSGVVASGNYPSATVGLSGTSTAAATFSRHLLSALPVETAPPGSENRLGERVVVETPARRRRLS